MTLLENPAERESSVLKLAESLAAAHFPDGPADPERLAKESGIAFAYAPFPEDFDGICQHHDGRFFIVMNDRRYRRGHPRSRFTFLHEVGHALIPWHREALMKGAWPAHYSRAESAPESLLEREADLFATQLLLPEGSVRRAAASLHIGLGQVAGIAEMFGASLTATAYRLLELELWPAPAAVFRWNEMGEVCGRRMSRATARLGTMYQGLADTPPPDSVSARAIRDLSFDRMRGFSNVMGWFPRLTGYDRGDQNRLQEEIAGLGQHGWLSIICCEGGASENPRD